MQKALMDYLSTLPFFPRNSRNQVHVFSCELSIIYYNVANTSGFINSKLNTHLPQEFPLEPGQPTRVLQTSLLLAYLLS